MRAKQFVQDLGNAFPAYEFQLRTAGAGWKRIFVLHHGVSLGRISLKPEYEGSYAIGAFKHYKPRDYEYEPEDRFFYLFEVWLATGKVPQIDFRFLVERAKELRREKTERIVQWRRDNPKKIKYYTVDSEGECIAVRNKRPKIDKSWMGEFRKLVREALEA